MADNYKTYTIVKGDNLTKISKMFGVSIKEIAELNGIKDINKIYAGAELKIPYTEEELKAQEDEAAAKIAEAKAQAAKIAAEKKAAAEAAAKEAAEAVEEEVEEKKETLGSKIANLFKKNS